MSNIRTTHGLLIRQAEGMAIASEALRIAELATRWVCQCENVVNVSRVGLPTAEQRHVALDYATEAAQQAFDHAQEACKAARRASVEEARQQLKTVAARELTVRRHVSDAGLAVNMSENPVSAMWTRAV